MISKYRYDDKIVLSVHFKHDICSVYILHKIGIWKAIAKHAESRYHLKTCDIKINTRMTACIDTAVMS